MIKISKGIVVLIAAVFVLIIFAGVFQPASIVLTQEETDLYTYYSGVKLYVGSVEGEVIPRPSANPVTPTSKIDIIQQISNTDEGLTPIANDGYYQILERTYTISVNGVNLENKDYIGSDAKYSKGSPDVIIPGVENEFDLTDYNVAWGSDIKISSFITFRSFHVEYFGDTPIGVLYGYTRSAAQGYTTIQIGDDPDAGDGDDDGDPGTNSMSLYFLNTVTSAGLSPVDIVIDGVGTYTSGSSEPWILAVPDGSYTVTVKKTGYYDTIKTVTVPGGDVTFYLTQIAVMPSTDADNDGMLDSWEIEYFGNLVQTASGDYDGDGVTNLAEYTAGTDPTDGVDSTGYNWVTYGYLAALGSIILATLLIALPPPLSKIKAFVSIAIVLAGFIVAHLFNTGVI